MGLHRLAPACLGLACALAARAAAAADVPADPSNYEALLATLQPGDTLVLAPGTYTRLTISGIHGTVDAPITIAGPAAGDPAVVVGESCCNTVQLYDSSFVTVRNLTIDVGGLEVDAVNAKDTPSHDIVIENNVMQGFPAGSQQIVGVNTKVTVWNWTIRGNRIVEPGTGIYLGGSEGDTPFVAGTIEGNVIVNPVGYCMQIKHQNDYTPLPDMPAGPSATIVRGNIFIKDDRDSPDGDRPNLLVGGFPDAGPGAEDLYHVYGNLLFYNPREALFQATGRVSIHDNIFVGAADGFAALVVTAHQGKSVKLAHVYNNTIFGGGTGISMAAASESDAVVGNLVFAATPLGGTITDERDNIVGTVDQAAQYVTNPVVMLGVMDFYPLADTVQGAAIDMTKFAADPDHDRDYNGTVKDFTFRGAYAGAGADPCGPLDDVPDDCAPGGTDDGGSDGGSADESGSGGTSASDGGSATASGSASAEGSATAADEGGGTGGGATDSAGTTDDDPGGCGCTADQGHRGRALGFAALLLAGARRRRSLTGWFRP